MKRFVLIMSTVMFASFSFAHTVSKERATRMALLYAGTSQSKSAPIVTGWNGNNSPVDTTKTYTFSITNKASLYVVQMEEGWVLVSSELAANPILASSPKEKFPDIDEMPDGMKWLISSYEETLQYAKDSIQNRVIHPKWMVETSYYEDEVDENSRTMLEDSGGCARMAFVTWNQSFNNNYSCVKPYNKFCPTWSTPSCGHTYAGCVAVAMGQVMWFWQWPHSAVVPLNMLDSAGNTSGSILKEYHWNKMPGAIYDSTPNDEVDEVAGLLRDCGYASKMKYKAHGSGASLADAEQAFEQKFHYKNVYNWSRKVYEFFGLNWITKLQTEIDAGRPVIYGGNEPNGEGHAFVLYGYSGNYFKINWGWGEVDNSYYSLGDVAPGLNIPFIDNQEALWGIEPDYPSCNDFNMTNGDINQSPIEFFKGGDIYVQNKTINNKTGIIYSGEAVHLLPTCTISAGSNIHIAVRDMHCGVSNNRGEDEMILAPTREETPTSVNTIHAENSFAVFPNPAMDRVTISSTEPIAQTMLYNLNGQLVLQTGETEINVSALSAGIYIIHAQTSSGQLLTAKFVHL